MGKVYLENIYGIKNPRIALMNIGEEEVKGNELTKTTHNLLKNLDINFVGNVEGRDVYSGRGRPDRDRRLHRQRHLEGFRRGGRGHAVHAEAGDHVQRFLQDRLFLPEAIAQAHQKETGLLRIRRSLLLGVNGIVIIGHGRSNAKAIKNAISSQLPIHRPRRSWKRSHPEIEKMQIPMTGVEIMSDPDQTAIVTGGGPRHRQGHRPATGHRRR